MAAFLFRDREFLRGFRVFVRIWRVFGGASSSLGLRVSGFAGFDLLRFRRSRDSGLVDV